MYKQTEKYRRVSLRIFLNNIKKLRIKPTGYRFSKQVKKETRKNSSTNRVKTITEISNKSKINLSRIRLDSKTNSLVYLDEVSISATVATMKKRCTSHRARARAINKEKIKYLFNV